MKTATLLCVMGSLGLVANAMSAEFRVKNRVVHTIDRGVFGQFLERDGPAEPGPEAAYDPDAPGALRPEVLAMLREMDIPHIRFPGGAGVEYGDPWTSLIDMPGDERSPTEEPRGYGFHEFFSLCEQLDAEPLIVVRLAGHTKPWLELSVEEDIQAAAAQVAYMNAEVDADLPEDLAQWPRLRAANGRPEPFGVRLWQLGNEQFWAFADHLLKEGVEKEEIARRYLEVLRRAIDAMKAVDPGIEILVDIQMEDNPGVPVLDGLMTELGEKIDYLSFHVYRSWAVDRILRDGEEIDPREFTFADYYYSFAAGPWIDPRSGLSVFRPPSWDRFVATGKPLAITEWNVNSWWSLDNPPRDAAMPSSLFAKGLGVADFFHAFFRAGDIIRLANQSMLLGSRWEIASIAVEPDAPGSAHWRPSGQVATLYSNHTGSEFLETELSGSEFFAQPFQLANTEPAQKVAYIDPVATREGNTLYLHLANRDLFRVRKVGVILEDFPNPAGQTVSLRRLRGRFHNSPADGEALEPGRIETMQLPVTELAPKNKKHDLRLTLPPASVSIYAIDLGEG